MNDKHVSQSMSEHYARITKEFDKEPVLDEEGHYHEYTEQDIYEQTRKRIRDK